MISHYHQTDKKNAYWVLNKWYFNKLCNNSDHCLHSLLPCPSTASQHYQLRQRAHNRDIPERTGHLTDSNFPTRLIHKHMYWLTFYNDNVFNIYCTQYICDNAFCQIVFNKDLSIYLSTENMPMNPFFFFECQTSISNILLIRYSTSHVILYVKLRHKSKVDVCFLSQPVELQLQWGKTWWRGTHVTQ